MKTNSSNILTQLKEEQNIL